MTDAAVPGAAPPLPDPLARIATLDILRGVAVMGILAMNIVAFAMPFEAYMNPLAYGGSDADIATWFANFVLVDGKMRGFFSFLFGASMLLVIERTEAGGGSGAEAHVRRMAWLLVFGLAHLYLIWWGDILSHYALIGLVAFLFHDSAPRTLIRWAIGLLVVSVVFLGSSATSFFQMEAAATAPEASTDAIRLWASASSPFAVPDAETLARDLALYRGGYADLVGHRLREMLFSPVFQLFFTGPETLAYMLLGMAGLKSGFLTGAWEPARYRRTATTLLAVTIPLYALLGWIVHASGFRVSVLFAIAFVATIPLRPLMILGYAGLVILLTRHGGALVDRIAAAGRAAFTNYLGTSLVMTTLFYGYGFGLYGELSRLALYLVVAAMWALMLLWSKPWLDRFRYGPFEWLWRSLARGEVQPMRRVAPS